MRLRRSVLLLELLFRKAERNMWEERISEAGWVKVRVEIPLTKNMITMYVGKMFMKI